MKKDEIFNFLSMLIIEIRAEFTPIDYNTALVGQHILDSLEFMNYITKVEERFHLSITDEEIEDMQLGVVGNMIDFLINKSQK